MADATQKPVEEKVEKGREEEKKESSRKRNYRNKKKNAPKEKTEKTEKMEKKEKPEAKPRPETLPIPAESMDKECTGTVTMIIRRGQLKFGFIHLGSDLSSPDDSIPRVYFSFRELANKDVTIRKGYEVKFTPKLDAKERQYASEISLTEKGEGQAVVREAEIAEKKKENPKPPSPPKAKSKGKKNAEVKNISMNVACEGKPDTKTIECNVLGTIGKLKRVACAALEVSLAYNVYANGEFLTSEILKGMEDGASIHLTPQTKKEETLSPTVEG